MIPPCVCAYTRRGASRDAASVALPSLARGTIAVGRGAAGLLDRATTATTSQRAADARARARRAWPLAPRRRYDAWAAVLGTSKEEAMAKYVETIAVQREKYGD